MPARTVERAESNRRGSLWHSSPARRISDKDIKKAMNICHLYIFGVAGRDVRVILEGGCSDFPGSQGMPQKVPIAICSRFHSIIVTLYIIYITSKMLFRVLFYKKSTFVLFYLAYL